MELKRDIEADIIYLEVGKGPIEYAKNTGNIVVHFSKDNVPVFIEILGAHGFAGKMGKVMKVKELLKAAVNPGTKKVRT